MHYLKTTLNIYMYFFHLYALTFSPIFIENYFVRFWSVGISISRKVVPKSMAQTIENPFDSAIFCLICDNFSFKAKVGGYDFTIGLLFISNSTLYLQLSFDNAQKSSCVRHWSTMAVFYLILHQRHPWGVYKSMGFW